MPKPRRGVPKWLLTCQVATYNHNKKTTTKKLSQIHMMTIYIYITFVIGIKLQIVIGINNVSFVK